MKSEKLMYENLLPEEFIERINNCPIAYLPLGSLEWHGLHMPLGADGIQSRSVFERIASQVGGVILPMLFLGPDSVKESDGALYPGMDYISFGENNPQQLEGSAYYIPIEKFNMLLDQIMENLKRAGFKIVIGHGHGPSTHAFADRKEIFKEKYGLITYNLWEIALNGREGIQTDHAAENETSIMMALKPELVDIKKLEPDKIPVAIWGHDPRLSASSERGDDIVDKNVNLSAQKLKSLLSEITIDKREIKYKDIKDLLN